MCKKNESGRRRKVGGKNDVGRRTKELASFHDTIRTWRRRKELVSRDGVTPRFTAVHRVFASTTSKIWGREEGRKREQDDAKDRERRASMGRVLRRINYK